jgi:hypothetical protein
MDKKIIEIMDIFKINGFYNGKIISSSKSLYLKKHPYHKVFFNANFYIIINNIYIKILYCDIDISVDGQKIKNIAKEISSTIFITPEYIDISDMTVSEVSSNEIYTSYMWDSTCDIVEITDSYIAQCKEQEEKEKLKLRIDNISYLKREIKINSKLPIKKFDELELGFVGQQTFSFEYFFKELNEFKRLITEHFSNSKPIRDNGILYEKYFKEYGYFSAYVFEKYLKEIYSINDDNIIVNPSSIWISRKLNKILRYFDLYIERYFDFNFKYSDFKRYITCNYCVDNIHRLNKIGANIDSYFDNVFYIRENIFMEKLI